MSPTSQPGQTVLELGCEYHERLKDNSRSLPEEVLRMARRKPLMPCMNDTSGRRLNYLQVMRVDPVDNLLLTKMRQEYAALPQKDEALRERIEDLDLLNRKAFF